MEEPRHLYSLEFITVTAVLLFAFLNVSVFYGFYSYLGKIGIAPAWKGFLLGLEPMAAFLFRPLVLSRLHGGNAIPLMIAALIMLVLILVSYLYVITVPGLVMIRILHGAAFVLLISAAFAIVVNFIPEARSAEGFGILSLATLVPCAVTPPATEYLLLYMENDAVVYAGMSLPALPAVVLLFAVRKRMGAALRNRDRTTLFRPTMTDVRESLRNREIVLLFGINFFIYISQAIAFFFMKDFATAAGIGHVGGFFAIYTAVMMAVRLLGGTLFDRLHKVRTLTVALAALSVCFLAIPFIRTEIHFYLLAAFYGLCVGVGIPMLNAALFTASPPQHRGLNTNLSLFMLDAGFFIGPYLGGALMNAGWSVSAVILSGVFFVLVGFGLSVMAMKGPSRHPIDRCPEGPIAAAGRRPD